ncbi:MAG: hypothetical protein CVT67_00770 [Actinobacteria bacterium HGW-Actinobacteria-7]|jgi:uncharacterized protein|nr:MAG: hypothetical protein CVT67_00770 [Actinobacteria bacterium HGW-Actinobacteria-7]
MVTYRVDVRPILEEIGGSVSVDGSVEFSELVVGDETFLVTAPITFSATITNAGDGIVAMGSIEAPIRATCSRCLCEFDSVIEGEIEGFYLQAHQERAEDDDAEGVDEDGAVDLGPALVAALVVEAPFAPLHDEDCAGLCSHCGADLNTERCDCSDRIDEDHPFAALRGAIGLDDAAPVSGSEAGGQEG